jgi:hypothetical protein
MPSPHNRAPTFSTPQQHKLTPAADKTPMRPQVAKEEEEGMQFDDVLISSRVESDSSRVMRKMKKRKQVRTRQVQEVEDNEWSEMSQEMSRS